MKTKLHNEHKVQKWDKIFGEVGAEWTVVKVTNQGNNQDITLRQIKWSKYPFINYLKKFWYSLIS
jgi:hypothetical protein